MSASMSNNNKVQSQQGFSLSMKIDEENVLMQMQRQKQGIVTILGSGNEEKNTASGSSLRRALSADMSSKKWLSQNSSSSLMKKIGSSEEEEEDYEESKELEAERLEIWSSIQRNKKEEQEKTALDTWSSIMSLKGKEENEIISKSLSLPITPYVHPLVKRTKSSLSEKSLEICTESLGSETGSDGLLFSSSPSSSPSSPASSETGETEDEEEKEKVAEEEEELEVPKQSYTKKSPPRSFPPPLPSLSRQTGPSSLHMRTHRDNGRLVLQAVSVPSLNNFSVQREDGRLVLTFTNNEEKEEENHGVEELEEEEEYFGGGFEFEGEEEEEYHQEEKEQHYEEEDEEEEEDSVIEEAPLLSSGVANVQSFALMMNNNNKAIGLVNKNPKWSEKFNDMDVNVVGVEVEPSQMAQSLPPRVPRLIPSTPSVASSFNFNAYEYYWRTKPSSKSPKPNNNNNNNHPFENHHQVKNNHNSNNKLIVSNEQQQLLVLRGKNGDYLVHNLKSCKDSRRSFLFWEPYCIATS